MEKSAVLEKLNATQECIKRLSLPPVKPDVLKATVTVPGVGCSNIDVKFKEAKMARVLNLDRLNRSDRARNNSGQNQSERSNIREALVDGASLQWNYYGPLDNLDEEEIKKLERRRRNAEKCLGKDVTERMHDEPGPAEDFMKKAFVTPRENEQFFFNAKQLREEGCSRSYTYFQEIETFFKEHA